MAAVTVVWCAFQLAVLVMIVTGLGLCVRLVLFAVGRRDD